MKKVRVQALTGIYEGYVDGNGVNCFLGIPYVQPPERWKPAKPLPISAEVVDATQYGPACWQPVFDEEWLDGTPQMSEDCLTLNIWANDVVSQGKPVMVWIHGGANCTGANTIDCCDGAYCADLLAATEPDIVFVNINYRLNAFGSMDLSAVDPEGEYKDSSNLQTLDQIAALQWIHDNIEAFGGDPENVTLYGQSAGAYSISTLMLIPSATKLFQKAICQSCSVDESLKMPEEAVGIGAQFLELTGATTLEECLALTPQQILDTVPEIMRNPLAPAFCAVRDGELVPRDIYAALEGGSAAGVTLMTGNTSGEYDTMAVGADEEWLVGRIKSNYSGEVTDEMIERFCANYSERDRWTALMDMHNDSMRLTNVKLSDCQAAAGETVFMYYIDIVDADDKIRPQHCYEIPLLHGRPDARFFMDANVPEPVQGRTPSAARVQLFQRMWTNFARFGNPSTEFLDCDWEPYSPETRATLVLASDGEHMQAGVRNLDADLMYEAATTRSAG